MPEDDFDWTERLTSKFKLVRHFAIFITEKKKKALKRFFNFVKNKLTVPENVSSVCLLSVTG